MNDKLKGKKVVFLEKIKQLPPILAGYLQLADAVMITDEKHTILDVNNEYTRTTGYEKREAIGQKAGFTKSQLTSFCTYVSLKEAIHVGKPWTGVLLNKKKCGDLWHSSLTITPIKHENAVYFIGVFRELEQLKEGMYLSEQEKAGTERELLRVLAISCEIRDPGIEDHLVNVQNLTEQLIVSFHKKHSNRFSVAYLSQIIHASILHDIGKAGIPEGILYKPGSLAEYERKIIEMHPLMGQDILSKLSIGLHNDFIKSLEVAENIIKYHHERWDGTGYPHGLKGEEIPFEARVVAIVDVYDALISRRPYKDSWPKEKAIEHIKSQRERYFDPELVDAFIDMF
ncbi:HD domain-containing phosphohydrolase [Niallia sp. NCCP-28]|uniref:HD domain-containing phosphohydrolase n=1 Tax=Niallia sp. NCCP-28 TaxID=2934712 RepID=UPI0020C07C21|nr:HD domain-containing phosphohydrolase [Niallia sp. NCCP-28]